VIARFAIDQLHAKKAGVLYDVASAYNKGIAEVFKQAFTEGGGQVVAFESYTTGEHDFSVQLQRIKGQEPDVLFLPNYDNEIPAQVHQARQAGIRATLVGSDTWGSIKPADRAELEGAYFSVGWSAELTSESSLKFVQFFRQTYNREPNDVAALSYDAVNLLLQVIKNQGKADPASIRDGLAGVKAYQGVTGNITYQGSGDPVKSAVISQVNGGKFVLYQQVDP
jgi:branched-chain amino acid transport system substrate-binding protein